MAHWLKCTRDSEARSSGIQKSGVRLMYDAALLQGNAEESMMIMVGDVLKKTSALFGDTMWDVEDFGRSMCVHYPFLIMWTDRCSH